jgi:hypothetical protein
MAAEKTFPNDFAFPIIHETTEVEQFVTETTKWSAGLTKREYFASLAMQGMLAAGVSIDIYKDYPFQVRAQTCIVIADALIEQLNKP